MEIMDYEKKVKQMIADEAISKEVAWKYFPELKESEEERIIKEIYNALKYLERELSWDALGEVDILDAYAWLEQSMQKPAEWTAEDEYNYNTILHHLDLRKEKYKKECNQEEQERYQGLYNWLKSLKERVGCEANCTATKKWSEDDKKMHDFALRTIGLCKQYAINNQINGYSKLPDTPQKYEELYQWLKSLKGTTTWKPSEEQMDALYTYIYNPQYFSSPDPRMELVESVYKDLKKLKGE